MWTALGIAVSLAVAAAAWLRSRVAGGHYDADTYGMTPQTHIRYVWCSLALALLLFASLFIPAIPVIGLLAVCVLVAILYLSSFLRGAQADD
jgi:hypothetical protein